MRCVILKRVHAAGNASYSSTVLRKEAVLTIQPRLHHGVLVNAIHYVDLC